MKGTTLTKTLAIAMAMLASTTSTSAQNAGKGNFFDVANRIGIGVGVGTEGIGIDVATPLGKYVQARVGLNIMPNISINTTASVSGTVRNESYEGDLDVKGEIGRTTVDLKLDCYPFPSSSSFFVTAGLSFGGGKLLKVSGHSAEYAALVAQGKQLGVEIGDYNIPIDKDGNVNGGVKVNGIRPYVGLGFGRLIPKKRFAARFELGAQFQGTPKAYADGVGDLDKVLDQDPDDDISKFMDYLKVYPVLKLSLRGRIL